MQLSPYVTYFLMVICIKFAKIFYNFDRIFFDLGWGFEKMDVYVGFIATIAWTIGLIAVSLIVVRVRKYTG